MTEGRPSYGPAAAGPTALRLVVTSLLLALPLVGQLISVPGIDPEAELSRMAGANTSLVALGLAPLLSAFWVVELAALIVPRWRKLRHGFPDGRARLALPVVIVALVLAAFQSFGVAMMLQASELAGDVNLLLVIVSLVAGTSLLLLVARQVERLGLVNGVLGLALVASFGEVAHGLLDLEPPTEPLALVAMAVALVLPVVATWAAMRACEPRPDTSSLQLSTPSSSMQPVLVAAALLGVPASLAPLLSAASEQLEELGYVVNGPHQLEIRVGLALLIGVGLVLLLQRPDVVASRLRALDGPELTTSAAFRTALASLPATGAFLVVIVVAEHVLLSSGFGTALAPNLALVTALVLDGSRALREQRARPDLLCVWEERRPYVVPHLLAAAQRHELELQVTGVAATSLLRFFGPYAAIKLWAPAADAARAREAIGPLLQQLNEPAAAKRAAHSDDGSAAAVAARPASAVGARLLLALGTLAVGLGVAVRLADQSLFMARSEVAAARADFAAVAVDDSIDSLRPDARDLPAGIAIFSEYVFLGGGPDERIKRGYARLVLQSGESLEQAERRIEPWVQSLRLPAGTRLGWEALAADEWSAALTGPDGEPAERVDGYRSYFLVGEPILTSRDIASIALTHAREDGVASLDISFTPDGDERLARASPHLLGKRLAISSGGLVRSAPVIRQAMSGGRIQISMGTLLEPGEAEAEARRLLQQLTSAGR